MERTCAGVGMLGAGVPGLELAGGLSLELDARFIPCAWQTTAAVATWLWILEVALVFWSVCGELAVAALLKLLVLLYLVPPRASPVTSTSMFSETLTKKILKLEIATLHFSLVVDFIFYKKFASMVVVSLRVRLKGMWMSYFGYKTYYFS